MAIELQMQAPVLAELLALTLQARLTRTCFPTIDDLYVDHVDVAPPGSASWEQGAGSVLLRLPLEVYILSQAELFATPNKVPAGATQSAGRVTAILEMAAREGVVTLESREPDLGLAAAVLGARADQARQTIRDTIGTALRIDLMPLLQQLGRESAPGSASVEIADDVVAIRFDPAGAPAGRLGQGQQWGLFLDGPGVEGLTRSFLPRQVPNIPGLVVEPHWRPQGGQAVIDVNFAGKITVPDPAVAVARGFFRCALSLVPGPGARLHADVGWDVDLDLGAADALGFLDPSSFFGMVDGSFASLKNWLVSVAFDPASFGATKTGNRTFTFDRDLPRIDFGDALLHYDGIAVSDAGMALGGRVAQPVDLRGMKMHFEVDALDSGTMAMTFCSQGAPPDETPRAEYFRVGGEISFERGGQLCGVEIVRPGAQLEPYLILPKPASMFGSPPSDGRIFMVLPLQVANEVNEQVTLVLRTARGVRFCNLGMPTHATVLPDGTVEGGQIFYMDDCLSLPENFYDMTPEEYERWSGMIWYTYWGLVPGRDYDPDNPPITPADFEDLLTSPSGWDDYLGERQHLDVQIVDIEGLDRGETVEFRSADHVVEVTADATGRALLPVIVPVGRNALRAQTARAMLSRGSRKSLAGLVRTRVTVFERQATLPAGTRNSFGVSATGDALVERAFGDRVELEQVTRGGAVGRLVGGAESLQPQANAGSAVELDLPGVERVQLVPGFAAEPLALAHMRDGSVLIVDTSDAAAPRVAGTFKGPIGEIAEDGGWAFAERAGAVDVFTAMRRTR